jgi:hemoglobin-like flavoprotein
MSQKEIIEARDSLTRCLTVAGFFDRFYELFLASSPEVAEKFKSTNFVEQKKMLESSLYLMLVAAGTSKGVGHSELERVAQRHSRKDLNIQPELYTLWLDCLMQAVSEHDPQYTPELDQAWREALKDGIELMKARY